MSIKMGRPRRGRFADRPENVEITTVSGSTYFRYVMPDGQRKSIGNSRDTQAAYDIATALNGHFAQQRNSLTLESIIAPRRPAASPHNPAIKTLIEEFKRHDPKRKKYSERTLENLDYALAVYLRRWGDRTVREMKTTDFATFLNELTDNAYVKNRGYLLRLMQFAGHQGYIDVNPMQITLKKEESDKVRERHTWEGYKTILDYKDTPDWLRMAMRVGLYSAQRREDLVLLHKTNNKVDMEKGTITILQRKTRNYKNPVWIEISMGTELFNAVEDCLRTEILCPFLIHYHPTKLSQKTRDAKPHPFAVTPGYLSNQFRKYRDASHAYDHLEPECRPTFHELRAFGMHLYEKAGYPPEYIMALSGHAKKATYDLYMKDHKQGAPKKVEAGNSARPLPK